MRGNYIKPSELLQLQRQTGKSYWDLIGRPLYDQREDPIENDPVRLAALLMQIDEALRGYDGNESYPKFDRGSDPDDDLINFIINHEGFSSTPINIGDGKLTIGSGLTDKKYTSLGKISEKQNRAAVKQEVANRRNRLAKTIPHWDELPDSAKNALISYDYNFPVNAKSSPSLLRHMNNRNWEAAAKEINAGWNMKGFEKGLRKRRLEEQQMFLRDLTSPPSNKPPYKPEPTPTSMPSVFESIPQIAPQLPQVLQQNQIVPPYDPRADLYQQEKEQRQRDLNLIMDQLDSKRPTIIDLYNQYNNWNRGKSFTFNFWNRRGNALSPVAKY